MHPERIQLHRRKGWKMPDNTVKVDRTTPLGNPFVAGTHGTRLECVGYYLFTIDGKFVLARGVSIDTQLATYNTVRAAAPSLRGKNLACWCTPPKPGEPDICHARPMLEFINNHPRATGHSDRIMRLWQETKKRTDIFIDAETVIAHQKDKAA